MPGEQPVHGTKSPFARQAQTAIFKDRRFILCFGILICIMMALMSAYVSALQTLKQQVSAMMDLQHAADAARIQAAGFHPMIRNTSLPIFAYSITGTTNDVPRIKRLLRAVFHPRNLYVIHLDRDAPARERLDLVTFVTNDPVLSACANVHVLPTGNVITYRGVSMLTTYLQCAAVLLHWGLRFDWYINLSASDYPLVTQDELIHAFSTVPRNLSFIDHTSQIGWKEFQRARPIAVDPGMYLLRKSRVFFMSQQRELPEAFKLFEGSAWVFLSREFLEWVIHGWDNLPRNLLIYFGNYISAPEWYFQTAACNSIFANRTINSDLHYITWDKPPGQHPRVLSLVNFPEMVASGMVFGRKFPREDPVLDKLDREILQKPTVEHFSAGGWCVGSSDEGRDPCWQVGSRDEVVPGRGVERLMRAINKILDPNTIETNQCK